MIDGLIAGVGAPRVGCSTGRAKVHNDTLDVGRIIQHHPLRTWGLSLS